MTARSFCSKQKETDEERAEMMGFRAWHFVEESAVREKKSQACRRARQMRMSHSETHYGFVD